ncbi:MAG TPA: Lrp/AsnC family transcriptional regulator [Candidatus Binataceae bacterium]|nr:Lrp/AsnC family transcriptional regulator [Candidatus Binataceae bacterium]
MLKKTLDSIDLKILRHLQDDATVPNVALARKVGLSPSPCLRRVQMLEEQGIIRQRVTLLDPAAVGHGMNVFVQVTLEKQTERSLQQFERKILGYPEVLECYLMTGEADYLLRTVLADMGAFERFVVERLTRIPGVSRVRSSFAMKQVKYTTRLPI